MFFQGGADGECRQMDGKGARRHFEAETRDKSLSAQFEHSIGITETEVECFTLSAHRPDQAAL